MKLETIVVYRIGSLGDTIVALPCFHRIARSFPAAKRVLLTNVPVATNAAPLQAILDNSGLIHEFIAYPIGTRSAGELFRISRAIRALRAETLVYLMPARGRCAAARDLVFFRLSGIRQIIGLPLTRDLQINRVDGQTGHVEPESERLVRTLSALGAIDLSDAKSWNLLLTQREISVGNRIVNQFRGSSFIVINMGGKNVDKDWGAERWSELLCRLTAMFPDYGLLIVGAPEDSTRGQVVAKKWRGIVVDACGRLSPRESAAALRAGSLFIGHDSGPIHLAAASNVRCIGLFGGLNEPRKWHPHGHIHRIIHSMGGMSSITVNQVLEAAESLLSAPPPS